MVARWVAVSSFITNLLQTFGESSGNLRDLQGTFGQGLEEPFGLLEHMISLFSINFNDFGRNWLGKKRRRPSADGFFNQKYLFFVCFLDFDGFCSKKVPAGICSLF